MPREGKTFGKDEGAVRLRAVRKREFYERALRGGTFTDAERRQIKALWNFDREAFDKVMVDTDGDIAAAMRACPPNLPAALAVKVARRIIANPGERKLLLERFVDDPSVKRRVFARLVSIAMRSKDEGNAIKAAQTLGKFYGWEAPVKSLNLHVGTGGASMADDEMITLLQDDHEPGEAIAVVNDPPEIVARK